MLFWRKNQEKAAKIVGAVYCLPLFHNKTYHTVGTGLPCKDHIVYKMFGDIVYTLHGVLSAVDSFGYDELFIHIDLSDNEVPVAYGNGLFIQICQFHVFVSKCFAEIIAVIV